ncbi:MAG TPA: hypothetical protein VJT09_02910 [Pyrinomonadaceae bacterium]|nr:hypothetical protein [Pyrinomonadaceae bacterium]
MFAYGRKLMASILVSLIAACGSGGKSDRLPVKSEAGPASKYSWVKVTDAAAFPGGYNFPVFTVGKEMWALYGTGWRSNDGRDWKNANLPSVGLSPAYQSFVQFNDAIYALGTMEGNYTNMKLGSRISRTSDLKRWEVVAEKSELPLRVFYSTVVFRGKIWMIGGWDGLRDYNDVWSSADGVRWKKVADDCAWPPRSRASAVVFKDRLWLIGGGGFDGKASNEVWSSADGINWTRATESMARMPIFGYSAIVYDDKIWLIGANRDGVFTSSLLSSDDGINWVEAQAPWSPRGGTATWVFDNKLYMTGGKYSVEENGNLKFIYSNDVWYMAPSKAQSSNASPPGGPAASL